jgi:lytic cellulose monooxygenase (C1-hydroxylating)
MKRVAFTFQATMMNNDGSGAIQDVNSKDLPCNTGATSPALVAPVRAGSNVDFIWTKFLRSHQGPITTWMAPYSGNISQVNVNNLEFFKIHEGGLYPDGKWATDRMIDQGGTFNTTIPYDIKPGRYVLRHELVALHFATEKSNYWYIPGGIVAPQFYPSCYYIEVMGNGTATPPGVKFPGAYTGQEPGLHFNIFAGNKEYPIPGPRVYKPSGLAPKLQQNVLKYISPTGTNNTKLDAEYLSNGAQEYKQWEQITDFFQAIGG